MKNSSLCRNRKINININSRNLMELCKDPDHLQEALAMASLIDQQGLPLHRDIIYNLLQHCAKKKDLEASRKVQFLIVNNSSRLDSIPVLSDHLIRCFSLCGSLQDALLAFRKVVNPTVFTWNSIISAHIKVEKSQEALLLYEEMKKTDVLEDKVTFLSVIKACSRPAGLRYGMYAHDRIVRIGLNFDVMIANSIVDMYAKCQSIDEARRVFDCLKERTVVSWSSMIKGHAQHGQGFLALDLFEKMRESSITPDKVLLSCILVACSTVEAIRYGRIVHHVLIEWDNACDTMIGSNLIDMYIKCGTIIDAQKVFNGVLHHDVALWGTLISGYAGYGDVDRAFLCLKHMKQEGLEPDEVIITSIVTACSQNGLLKEGHEYFNLMESFGDSDNARNVEHYNGMVDLLTRSGSLEEASCLLRTMPISPDLVGWRCLLAGCRLYGNVVLAKHCFDELVLLDPSDSSAYILMIDVYTKAEMWEDVKRLNHLRMKTQLDNESPIEVQSMM